MRGRYLIACQGCQRESEFTIEVIEDRLEVVSSLSGCMCPERPDDDEAKDLAARDFTNRIEGYRWAALAGRGGDL